MTPLEAFQQLAIMARAAAGNAADHERRAEAEQVLAALLQPVEPADD